MCQLHLEHVLTNEAFATFASALLSWVPDTDKPVPILNDLESTSITLEALMPSIGASSGLTDVPLHQIVVHEPCAMQTADVRTTLHSLVQTMVDQKGFAGSFIDRSVFPPSQFPGKIIDHLVCENVFERSENDCQLSLRSGSFKWTRSRTVKETFARAFIALSPDLSEISETGTISKNSHVKLLLCLDALFFIHCTDLTM